jgi:hypothetical protein
MKVDQDYGRYQNNRREITFSQSSKKHLRYFHIFSATGLLHTIKIRNVVCN